MQEQDPYHALDLISNSRLGVIKSIVTGASIIKAKKETLDFGKQFHECVFEYDKYINKLLDKSNEEQYVSYQANRFRVSTMSIAACGNALLDRMLKSNLKVVEHNVFFNEEYYGVDCKAKLDIRVGDIIGDLKSTSAQSKEEFEATCIEYGYFRQGAFYMDHCQGKQFILFGVSKKYPHRTFTVIANYDDPRIIEGRKEYQWLIEEYLKLKQKGEIDFNKM